MLGWIVRRGECRGSRESKAPIVAMIANEHASLGALPSQDVETRLDELPAHTAPLKRRLHRERAEGTPTLERRRPNRRECNVANKLPADEADE